MKLPRRSRNEKGMTVLELVVVIGVVGILAAIAIPNYNRYRIRAMHTQAKIALSDLYVSEQAFKAEYGVYTSRLDSMAYDLTGMVYYDIGFKTDSAPSSGPAGTPGCNSVCGSPSCPPRPGKRCLSSAREGLDGNISNATSSATDAAFTGEAHGHLGPTQDEWFTWSIDHLKRLRQHFPAN